MGRYFIILVCSLMIVGHLSYADVPMLDASTVEMPNAKTLNKCIDANNKVIYTQFECRSNAKKAEDDWKDKANLTYLTPEKNVSPALNPTQNVMPSVFGDNLDNATSGDQNMQSGMDLLKDAMKDKSLLELFDDGIKVLMLRQEILNSL